MGAPSVWPAQDGAAKGPVIDFSTSGALLSSSNTLQLPSDQPLSEVFDGSNEIFITTFHPSRTRCNVGAQSLAPEVTSSSLFTSASLWSRLTPPAPGADHFIQWARNERGGIQYDQEGSEWTQEWVHLSPPSRRMRTAAGEVRFLPFLSLIRTEGSPRRTLAVRLPTNVWDKGIERQKETHHLDKFMSVCPWPLHWPSVSTSDLFESSGLCPDDGWYKKREKKRNDERLFHFWSEIVFRKCFWWTTCHWYFVHNGHHL